MAETLSKGIANLSIDEATENQGKYHSIVVVYLVEIDGLWLFVTIVTVFVEILQTVADYNSYQLL